MYRFKPLKVVHLHRRGSQAQIAYQAVQASLAGARSPHFAINRLRGSTVSRDFSVLPTPHQSRIPRQPSPEPPSPKPLPAITRLPVRPLPDEPIMTRLQRGMLDSFRAYGRLGLVECIYEEAKERKSGIGGKYWDFLKEDWQTDCSMLQLSMLLPDAVLESLIRKSFASDCWKDSEIRQFASQYMNLELPCAGIYVNILTNSPKSFEFKRLSIASNVESGKWLTSDQVKTVLQKVKIYVVNKSQDG